MGVSFLGNPKRTPTISGSPYSQTRPSVFLVLGTVVETLAVASHFHSEGLKCTKTRQTGVKSL